MKTTHETNIKIAEIIGSFICVAGIIEIFVTTPKSGFEFIHYFCVGIMILIGGALAYGADNKKRRKKKNSQ